MRRALLFLIVLAASLPTFAQELPPTALSETPLSAKREVRREALLDPVDLSEHRLKDLDHEKWRVAFDFGLPNGIRVQRRIGESNFWMEGGVGAWWIVPYVSGCIRYDWQYLQTTRNCFSFRPGLSATAIGIGAFGVGWDCESVWTHRYRNNLRTDLGFRFGMTCVFNTTGDGNKVFPAPVLSLVFNLAF
jgi:hypothetical protein